MSRPRISLIIPCFNMSKYIEQTLVSIINQDFGNLELIVVDGGSNDGTLEILEGYKKHFAFYISEKDDGQYDAIKKGFSKATGDILCWLNADDIYFPWTLEIVSTIFERNSGIKWLCGLPAFLDEKGLLKKIYTNISAKDKNAIMNGWYQKDGFGFLQQESMFWKKDLYTKVGGLNLKYSLAADFELWTRFAEYSELYTVNLPLAAFRMRKSSLSKANEKGYLKEIKSICGVKKKIPLPFRILGKYMFMNKILRLLKWKRTKIINRPLLTDEFIFEERVCSFSSLSLSQLLLEYSQNKNSEY